jgi:cytidylate kinase
MKKIIIAIDGPAGSGKSTTARIVAEKLGYVYIDTGAMYRAVTLAWLRIKEELAEHIICAMLANINIELKTTEYGLKTYLNNEDVSDDIRMPEVTKYVSPVSAIACVREKLVEMQRRLGEKGGVVMDGRDIGSVVFPNAELKIFLVASVEARAKRRFLELYNKGFLESEENIKIQITERDKYDSSRKISPLVKAEDAIEVDTSLLTIEEQTEKVFRLVLETVNKI